MQDYDQMFRHLRSIQYDKKTLVSVLYKKYYSVVGATPSLIKTFTGARLEAIRL